MPVTANVALPKPESWDGFERLMAEIVAENWGDSHATRYASSGQRQHGVDIYCQLDNLDADHCGVQCKRTDDLAENEIRDEIEKAEAFEPALDEYVIATTADRDKSLQDTVNEISQDRVDSGKFSVRLRCWESIQSELAQSIGLLAEHYPQFNYSNFANAVEAIESSTLTELEPETLEELPVREVTTCWRVGFNLAEVRTGYPFERWHLTLASG